MSHRTVSRRASREDDGRASPSRKACGRTHHRRIAKGREDVNRSAVNCKKFSADVREQDRNPNVCAHLPGRGWFVLQREFEDCRAALERALSALRPPEFPGSGAWRLRVTRGRSNEND